MNWNLPLAIVALLATVACLFGLMFTGNAIFIAGELACGFTYVYYLQKDAVTIPKKVPVTC